VYALASRLQRGESIDDLLEDFRHLDRDSIDVAVTWALAHPRRGRPVASRASA
jgi:uncharacterized protein (DUF433 family)